MSNAKQTFVFHFEVSEICVKNVKSVRIEDRMSVTTPQTQHREQESSYRFDSWDTNKARNHMVKNRNAWNDQNLLKALRSVWQLICVSLSEMLPIWVSCSWCSQVRTDNRWVSALYRVWLSRLHRTVPPGGDWAGSSWCLLSQPRSVIQQTPVGALHVLWFFLIPRPGHHQITDEIQQSWEGEYKTTPPSQVFCEIIIQSRRLECHRSIWQSWHIKF